ncbi:MAG: class I SAM-dependent methyltransferase [Puniceicoccales bacterium]|jgi:SAM-dependent methyltransferase|nr:class I SAM-dependent methyltransferase [Puniceicoccales bacterium]
MFFYVLLRARVSRCIDYCAVIFKFYIKNHNFAKTDFAILSEYWLDSPFAISKRYLQLKLEPDLYQYGETPLLTIEKIAKQANITERDCVFELGCGTGRCAFWLAYFTGCRIVGIEQIPDFVNFSGKLVEKNDFLKGKINFIEGNFLSADLSPATVIYCYGTKLTNAQIEALILNLDKVRPGTIVITVSFHLNEIISLSKNQAILKKRFLFISKFDAEFFWGQATVFVQKVLV